MRLGQVAFTLQATADIGRAFLWLSQPGSGRNAASHLEALSRAFHQIAEAPHRWPARRDMPRVRERALRGGHLIIYRVVTSDASESGAEEIEIVRVLGPRQRRSVEEP